MVSPLFHRKIFFVFFFFFSDDDDKQPFAFLFLKINVSNGAKER